MLHNFYAFSPFKKKITAHKTRHWAGFDPWIFVFSPFPDVNVILQKDYRSGGGDFNAPTKIV